MYSRAPGDSSPPSAPALSQNLSHDKIQTDRDGEKQANKVFEVARDLNLEESTTWLLLVGASGSSFAADLSIPVGMNRSHYAMSNLDSSRTRNALAFAVAD